jgi:hypothetical protein
MSDMLFRLTSPLPSYLFLSPESYFSTRSTRFSESKVTLASPPSPLRISPLSTRTLRPITTQTWIQIRARTRTRAMSKGLGFIECVYPFRPDPYRCSRSRS